MRQQPGWRVLLRRRPREQSQPRAVGANDIQVVVRARPRPGCERDPLAVWRPGRALGVQALRRHASEPRPVAVGDEHRPCPSSLMFTSSATRRRRATRQGSRRHTGPGAPQVLGRPAGRADHSNLAEERPRLAVADDEREPSVRRYGWARVQLGAARDPVQTAAVCFDPVDRAADLVRPLGGARHVQLPVVGSPGRRACGGVVHGGRPLRRALSPVPRRLRSITHSSSPRENAIRSRSGETAGSISFAFVAVRRTVSEPSTVIR